MSLPQPPAKTTAFRDLLIALPLAFALRLALLMITQRAIDMPDSIHYINMAQQFFRGDFGGFDENLPVLYSALAALAYGVLRDWEWAFWSVSLISSTFLLIPVYHIARELHGVISARLSLVLLVLWPWYVDYGSRIAPEALAVTLWFSAVWWLYRGVQGHKMSLWCAALAFFALHLTRPEGTFLMLASPFIALVLCEQKNKAYWGRWVGYTGVMVLMTVIYALVMQRVIGTYTISYRAPMSSDWLDYFQRGALPLVKTFIALLSNVIPIMLGPFLLILFGVGFFRYSDTTRKPRLEIFLGLFCLVQIALTLANFSPAPRYMMAVILVMSLGSVKGIELLQQRARYWPRRRWVGWMPLVCVLGSFMLGLAEPVAREVLGATPATPIEYRSAGQWMREHLEPGVIVSRKPQVGFYASMPTLGPNASDTLDSLLERAREEGLRYMVYDERYSSALLPALRGLLDTTRVHEHYTLLHDEVAAYDGTRVVIYAFTPPGIVYQDPDAWTASTSHRGPDASRRLVEQP